MKHTQTVPLIVSALALSIVLAGCKQEAPVQVANPPQVGVVTLQSQTYTVQSELPGRTSPFRVAEVRPQVDGIIQQRLFDEGSEVKGQALYRIDPSPYEADVARARASFQQARSLADAIDS